MYSFYNNTAFALLLLLFLLALTCHNAVKYLLVSYLSLLGLLIFLIKLIDNLTFF